MSCGSLSARASAASPTAATLPTAVSMAIAVGSSSTMPRPATQTSVLTVPRSIATLLRKRMLLPSATAANPPSRDGGLAYSGVCLNGELAEPPLDCCAFDQIMCVRVVQLAEGSHLCG